MQRLPIPVFAAALVLAFATALAGCGTTASPIDAEPRARVVAVRETAATPQGFRVLATVEATNPGPVELPVRSADIRLTIEGVGTFTTLAEPAVALPPEGRVTFDVAAAYPRTGKASRVPTATGRAWDGRIALTVEPPGEIRAILTESGVPLPTVTASGRGRVGAPAAGGNVPAGADGSGFRETVIEDADN